MTRSKSGLLVGLAAVAAWTVSTRLNHAQTTATPASATHVAVVDVVKVFNAYKKTEALNELRQAHLTRLGQEADRRQTEIKAQQAERDAFAPDSADWFERDKKYRKLMFEYRVWEMTEQELIVQQHLRWIRRTYQDLTEEIEKLAKERGLDLVITSSQLETENVTDPKALVAQILNRKVVYAREATDLTEDVLRAVNAGFERAGGAKALKFTD